MSLKPKKKVSTTRKASNKSRKKSRWGNIHIREELRKKGWKRINDDTWKKKKEEVALYQDDDNTWMTDSWKEGLYVNIAAGVSRTTAVHWANHYMLGDKSFWNDKYES